jgi:hypothetical protein
MEGYQAGFRPYSHQEQNKKSKQVGSAHRPRQKSSGGKIQGASHHLSQTDCQ